MNAAIRVANLAAGYHKGTVLDALSFTVATGDMVGILGPNGAGKSTLFRVLSGLLRPRQGTVELFGRDVTRIPAAERARLVAVVPQELDIPVAFTVEELVMLGRTAVIGRWHRPTPQDHQAIERALVYTDVADIRDRPFNELSGGEKQRAIVALAIAQEPRIILMDEATSHLDINHRLEIMQLVERLNAEQNVTVLMISHDLQLAAEFARRLLVLDHGRLAADGPPAAVLTEDLLRAVYHCAIRVVADPQTGALNVLPARPPTAGGAGRGIRLHVITGGGCAEELLRRLTLDGYTVTCGVTNRGDSDSGFAEALGAAQALEEPFSPVGAPALEAARALVRQADAAILAPVPFGPGNVANLDLLDLALDLGKPVFVMDGVATRDYTPNRAATDRLRRLLERGARPWAQVADLLALLPTSEAQRPAVAGNR